MRVRVACTLSPDAKKGNPKAAPPSPSSMSLGPARVFTQHGAQQVLPPDLAIEVELQPRESLADLSAEASCRQLLGHVLDRSLGDGGGVFQEGAQESHGGELHGHAETGVAPSASGDKLKIDLIEVEEPSQLGWRWLAAGTMSCLFDRADQLRELGDRIVRSDGTARRSEIPLAPVTSHSATRGSNANATRATPAIRRMMSLASPCPVPRAPRRDACAVGRNPYTGFLF